MKHIFDFDDSDLIFPISDKFGIDMDGDFMMRLSNRFSMDMDSGDLHFTSDWHDNEDE